MATNFYHVDVVRIPLTRNLGARMTEVCDEIVQSFSDVLPFKGKGDGKLIPRSYMQRLD